MEFLFDLLLTAFFSLLFAFFLSKLFSPSTSTSSATSSSSSSHDAADVISTGARLTEEDDNQKAEAPRLREGGHLQEEKIIEVDQVVRKEAERGFLAQEVRAEFSDAVAIDHGKVQVCEGTEQISDGFGSDVEVEKENLDRGSVQKDESFELETSVNSDKEKESCASEVVDGKVSQTFYFTSLQDETIVLQEESLVAEAKLSEAEVGKDDTDNLSEVEGPIDKMPREVEVVEVPTEETSCLKEEHELKIDGQDSVIVQEEFSQETEVPIEVTNAKDEEQNLGEVEGLISKTADEDGARLKDVSVPEEISIETTKSKEQEGTDPIESSAQEKGKEQEEQENLSKDEGPTSKMTQWTEIGENKPKNVFIEEEGWEGIERTDTENQFAVAARYATSACGSDALAKLSNEVQLQLYGLHKVATEGPCYESNPMALRTSTGAKWHAWQKLGNKNPEAAMDEYLTLLSENVPDWSEQSIVEIEHKESDKLTTGSGSCIEGPVASGSVSRDKGTELHASIQ